MSGRVGWLEPSGGERPFEVEHAGERIPGIAWLPPDGILALFGHGFTTEKRCEFLTGPIWHWLERYGIAAVSVDAPCHGDRRLRPDRTPEQVAEDYLAYWREHGGGRFAGSGPRTRSSTRVRGHTRRCRRRWSARPSSSSRRGSSPATRS